MGRVARITTVVVLFLASLPTLVVLISSFSSGKSLDFPPPGVSLHGYSDLLKDGVVMAALVRSIIVGLECVLISLPIGMAAAFALNRYRVPGRGAFNAFLLLGFSSPLVVSGMGFLVLLTRLGLIGSLWPMSVAIVTVNFPFGPPSTLTFLSGVAASCGWPILASAVLSFFPVAISQVSSRGLPLPLSERA